MLTILNNSRSSVLDKTIKFNIANRNHEIEMIQNKTKIKLMLHKKVNNTRNTLFDKTIGVCDSYAKSRQSEIVNF